MTTTITTNTKTSRRRRTTTKEAALQMILTRIIPILNILHVPDTITKPLITTLRHYHHHNNNDSDSDHSSLSLSVSVSFRQLVAYLEDRYTRVWPMNGYQRVVLRRTEREKDKEKKKKKKENSDNDNDDSDSDSDEWLLMFRAWLTELDCPY